VQIATNDLLSPGDGLAKNRTRRLAGHDGYSQSSIQESRPQRNLFSTEALHRKISPNYYPVYANQKGAYPGIEEVLDGLHGFDKSGGKIHIREARA
jgi:hypothetical protein